MNPQLSRPIQLGLSLVAQGASYREAARRVGVKESDLLGRELKKPSVFAPVEKAEAKPVNRVEKERVHKPSELENEIADILEYRVISAFDLSQMVGKSKVQVIQNLNKMKDFGRANYRVERIKGRDTRIWFKP